MNNDNNNNRNRNDEQLKEVKRTYNTTTIKTARQQQELNPAELQKLKTKNKNVSFFQEKTLSLLKKIPKFVIEYLAVIIVVAILFLSGGSLLYITKICQLHLLKNVNCTDRKIPDVLNSFWFTNNENNALKMAFLSKDNLSNTILDYVNKHKDSSKSPRVFVYLLSIVASLIKFYLSAIQTGGKQLSKLPDELLILFSPLLWYIGSMLLFFAGNGYFIFLWFFEMQYFFKEFQKTDDEEDRWQFMNIVLNPFGIFSGFILACIACGLSIWVILFIFLQPPTLLAVPFVLVVYIMYCVFTLQGKIDGNDSGIVDIVKKMFVYNRPMFFGMTCFIMLMRSNILDMIPKNKFTSSSNTWTSSYKQTPWMLKINDYAKSLQSDYSFTIACLSIIGFLFMKKYILVDALDYKSFVPVELPIDLDCDESEKDGNSFFFKSYMNLKGFLDKYLASNVAAKQSPSKKTAPNKSSTTQEQSPLKKTTPNKSSSITPEQSSITPPNKSSITPPNKSSTAPPNKSSSTTATKQSAVKKAIDGLVGTTKMGLPSVMDLVT